MLRFHFCEDFENKIHGEPFEELVKGKILENSKRDKLRNTGSITCFGCIYILRTNTPKTRTIIQEKRIELNNQEVNAYFIRDIIFGNNFDYHYGKVIFNQLKNNEWLENNPLPEKEIEQFFQNYEAEKKQHINQTEKTPAHLMSWLTDYKVIAHHTIFEMESWVKYALNDSVSIGMNDTDVKTFAALLNDVIQQDINVLTNVIKAENEIKICTAQKYDIGVIYSRIEMSSRPVFVLFNAAHLRRQSEHWETAISEIQNTAVPFEKDINSISRNAYRAYPHWTVSDYDKWFAIQKNHELSNLSLTVEQMEFFEKFKFPCYINGQAGSGKSTMLYYLFANTYWYKSLGEIQGDIIFLTENEHLLDVTRQSVFDLLSNNPEFNDLTFEHRKNVSKHFASFKEFLQALLPESDRQFFPKEKYLSFAKFKGLYEESYIEHYIKNRYSAEEAWFTIINYIYGYEFDKTITDYSYYNKKDIINKIPKETFDGIVEHVLPYYRKLIEEEEYWDKLKIIKYINENIVVEKKYAVVMCDEAQDFCKVELQFILYLSEYLKYDLSETEQVPIVFAGDPNQTVNPSGFREREMNDMLYTELEKVSFNYNKGESVYDPKFNFRSAQPVISLANFIQYYRRKNFDIRMVAPQIPKRPEPVEERNFNFFYNYEMLTNQPELKENLKDIIKYKRFIVPVDSHEIEKYRSSSPLLSLIPDIDIKTAIESKGAEYKQVVLYGFGEYYLERIGNLTDNDQIPEFVRRYFFNKLYVGITRAQDELIIIDSRESQDNFWKKLVDEIKITERLWQEQLLPIQHEVILYDADSVNGLIQSTRETALENAKRDKEQGMIDENPSRLKLAGNQFVKFGKIEEGYNCFALAEEILLNYKKAGDTYLKNNKFDRAATAYFKGELFEILKKEAKLQGKTLKTDLQIILSQLMLGDKLLSTDIELLYKQRHLLHEITTEINWRRKLINALIQDAENKRENEQQRNLIDILETIAHENDTELWKIIAEKHYKLRYFERAIDIWDRVEMLDTKKYTLAKIELAKTNNNQEEELIWLGELIDYKTDRKELEKIENRIVQLYRNNMPNENISNHYYFLVAYRVFLIQNSSDIQELGQTVEQHFEYELSNLIDFYEKLLTDKRLNEKIAEFVIERIAKNRFKLQPETAEWLEEFNVWYQETARQLELLFYPFSEKDIEELPILPGKIYWEPPNFLTNMTVKNFRRFEELELTNLGNFNLIVGDNNVGKTSVLEALLFSADANIALKQFALAHTERIRLQPYLDENRNEQFSIPAGFFNDLVNNKSDNKEVNFILKAKRARWKFGLRPAQQTDFEETHGIDYSDFLVFENQYKKKTIELPVFLKNIVPYDTVLSTYIPFGKGFDKDLAQVYFDEVEKKRQIRKSFLENMRVFIPHIDRISANPETGEISIEENTNDEAAPLHQYGEGANKLFRILLQMTLQKENRILIDEIDAGIHHSRFRKFWEVILKVAQKENIQLFATTHNIECVRYFKDMLQTSEFNVCQDVSRVITLQELPAGKVKAYTRCFGEFEYELDNNFEIRGGDL